MKRTFILLILSVFMLSACSHAKKITKTKDNNGKTLRLVALTPALIKDKKLTNRLDHLQYYLSSPLEITKKYKDEPIVDVDGSINVIDTAANRDPYFGKYLPGLYGKVENDTLYTKYENGNYLPFKLNGQYYNFTHLVNDTLLYGDQVYIVVDGAPYLLVNLNEISKLTTGKRIVPGLVYGATSGNTVNAKKSQNKNSTSQPLPNTQYQQPQQQQPAPTPAQTSPYVQPTQQPASTTVPLQKKEPPKVKTPGGG